MRSKLLFALVIIAGFSAPAVACQGTPARSSYGEDVHIDLEVESGMTCGSSLRLGSMIKSFEVTKPPLNGSVSVTGYKWRYQSRSGFKGKDAFVLTLIYEAQGGARTSKSHINVTVK